MTAAERRAAIDGARSASALLVGMVPWGMVTGLAMITAGLTPVQALAMSLLVYAGSAQLAILPLFVAGAPLWVMLVTALMINLRYVIYSAVLAPYFGHLSRVWRATLSYLVIDGLFAAFVARHRGRSGGPERHWHFLGGSLFMWTAWQTATAIGIFASASIPRSWSLEFASTLAVIALVIPLLYDRAVVCGALASGVVAVWARGLPMNLGFVVAIATGIAVGVAAARLIAPDARVRS